MERRVVQNGDGCIEYFVKEGPEGTFPLVVSMGNWEPAHRSFPLLAGVNDRKCVALSYRGRGGSSTPTTGWDWRDHATDLAAVVAQEKLEKAVFLAFSKGVSYTLGYLATNPKKAAGLILIDYPAIHDPSVEGYATFWHSMVYKGIRLGDHVRYEALAGIEKESTKEDFFDLIAHLECPVRVFVGRNHQAAIPSNLTDQDLNRYRAAGKHVDVVPFLQSGHMVLDDEPDRAAEEVRRFLGPLGELPRVVSEG